MSLAKPGDPYVAPTGAVVVAENGPDADLSVLVPIANRLAASAKRSVKDLPTDPQTQTGLLVVLTYSIIGLTENEIAAILNITIQDVQQFKALPAYQESFEILFNELISINSSSIQARLSKASQRAVNRVIELVDTADKDIVRLKAAQDIMDRSGLSPQTLYGSKEDGFDSLKIVIEDGEKSTAPRVSIDIGKKR